MYNAIFREIVFYSRLNPDAPAIVAGGRQVSYARFASDIEKVTRALAAEALPAGARVAVDVQQAYRAWLVLIALARMGMPTASADLSELPHVGATVFISDRPAPELPPGVQLLALSTEWFGRMPESLPPYRESPQDPRELCRVVLSSGTTGVPKRVGITHQQLQLRCMFVEHSYAVGQSARFLTGVGVSTVGGFVFPMATWYSGGAVVLAGDNYAQAMQDDGVTAFFSSPTRIAQLLHQLPADSPVFPGLTVYTGGAPLSVALNRQIRQRLTPNLYIIYGATEVATVTMARAERALDQPGYVGHCVPYSRLEVVDSNDKPVPAGEEGILRVRGGGMPTGYLEDAEATSTAFQGGWFYPGDTGRLDKSGALQVVGRVTEVANLGGVKIAPSAVDEALEGYPGVVDLAAFSVPGPNTDKLWLAVVAPDGFDQEGLLRRYAAAFPKYPALHVIRMSNIPRNEMGKAMRARLRELTERALTDREVSATQAKAS